MEHGVARDCDDVPVNGKLHFTSIRPGRFVHNLKIIVTLVCMSACRLSRRETRGIPGEFENHVHVGVSAACLS